MKLKSTLTLATILFALPSIAEDKAAIKTIIDEKYNGDFEKGFVSPWKNGYWCSSGKKPETFDLSVTNDKGIVANSKYALSIKASGDSSGKTVSSTIYSSIPVNVEQNGDKFTLTCDLRSGENSFTACNLQLFILGKSCKFLGAAQVIKDQTITPSLSQDKWVKAKITAIIPADKVKETGYIQVRLNFHKNNSDSKTIYENFIDNIKLTQQK